MVSVVVAAGAGSVLTAGGCTGCTTAVWPALNVTVLDGPGRPEICGATVTAMDAAFTETLGASGTNPCSYAGALERPGVYTIEATFEGPRRRRRT
jgi:hypothetical protein